MAMVSFSSRSYQMLIFANWRGNWLVLLRTRSVNLDGEKDWGRNRISKNTKMVKCWVFMWKPSIRLHKKRLQKMFHSKYEDKLIFNLVLLVFKSNRPFWCTYLPRRVRYFCRNWCWIRGNCNGMPSTFVPPLVQLINY